MQRADSKRGQRITMLWLGGAVLGVLAFLNHLSPDIYRLTLADETLYLRNGLNFRFSSFSNYETFPLHSAWYALLNLFNDDPIRIFKVGAVLSLSLVVLLVVLVSQKLSRLPSLALLLGFALIATPILGVNASPFAQRTAMIVILGGVGVAAMLKQPALRAVAMGLAFFIASFARSEFILSFYMLTIGLVAYVLLGQRNRAGLRILGIYAAGVLLLSLCFSFPLLAGSDRSMMAFGQHYALQLQEQGVDIDPWLHWREAMAKTFGESHSVQAAMFHNPAAFFGHLRWSALGLMGWVKELHPLSLILLALSSCLWVQRLTSLLRGLRKQRNAEGEAQAVLLFCLGLGLIPIAISVLLVAPRHHYLQQFTILSYAMGALSLGGLLMQRPLLRERLGGKLAFIAALALVLWASPVAPEPADRNAQLVTEIRAHLAKKKAQSTRSFSMFRGLSTYIFQRPREFYFTNWLPEQMDLPEFLVEREIEFVFLDRLRIPKQKEIVQKRLNDFIEEPKRMGFQLFAQDDRALIYRLIQPAD